MRQRAGIERLDREFRRVARRHTERTCRRAGQERDNTELDRSRLLGSGRLDGERGARDRNTETDLMDGCHAYLP